MDHRDVGMLVSFVAIEAAWFPVLRWLLRGDMTHQARRVAALAVAFVMFLPCCIPLLLLGIPAMAIVAGNQVAAFAICAACWLVMRQDPPRRGGGARA